MDIIKGKIKGDVAIVGGGLSGAVAAKKLAQEGLEVLLLRKGYGSTALSSGTFDVASGEGGREASIPGALQKAMGHNPFHPYHCLKDAQEVVKALKEVSHDLFSSFKTIEMRGSLETNMLLITSWGTIKATAFSQSTLSPSDLGKMEGAQILLLLPKGMAGLSPQFWCQSLKALESPAIHTANWASLDFPKNIRPLGLHPLEVARALDEHEEAERFMEAVEEALKGQNAITHLAFPPLLGIDRCLEIHKELQERFGLPCFELVAYPPQAPGLRLQRAIDELMREQRVEMVFGQAVRGKAQGSRVKSLEAIADGEAFEVEARAFILATGKFIPGGIEAHETIREPIFNLPLFSEGKKIQPHKPLSLWETDLFQRHRAFSSGIMVNPSMQPLGEDGGPPFENLFACGSVLSGYDSIRDGCGLGVCLLTGYLAGQHAKRVM